MKHVKCSAALKQAELSLALNKVVRPGMIESIRFDNRTLRELPVDPIKDNFPRQVSGAFFSHVEPTPVINPVLVAASPSALALMGIDQTETSRNDFVEYFSGNRAIPGTRPAAHCYCGHQFGAFSGQLGDGATMYLGEVLTGGSRMELQFKGAGLTPYSRTADGRKVLRSSIREFLCSEAMAALGVPTTRAATIISSDSRVVRDVLYTGNYVEERCAVITRLAPTVRCLSRSLTCTWLNQMFCLAVFAVRFV